MRYIKIDAGLNLRDHLRILLFRLNSQLRHACMGVATHVLAHTYAASLATARLDAGDLDPRPTATEKLLFC